KDEVNAKDVEVVTSDHELVNLKGKPDFRSLGKRFGKDTPRAAAAVSQLTADLMQEGLARELVNRVQRLRKDAGYQYTSRIELSIAGPDDVVAAVATFQSYVEGETLARKTVLGAVL